MPRARAPRRARQACGPAAAKGGGSPPRGALSRSVRAAPAEHDRDRLTEDLHVPPQRPVRDVDVVELDHLVERDLVAAEDLPQAGDARGRVEAATGPAGDPLGLVDHEGARAD